jgi:hypothetical protein
VKKVSHGGEEEEGGGGGKNRLGSHTTKILKNLDCGRMIAQRSFDDTRCRASPVTIAASKFI